MSRALIAIAALAGVALPIGVGVYALSAAPDEVAQASGLDQQLVERAVETPVSLTPPPEQNSLEVPDVATSLADMAENDPEGAVALVRQALLDNPLILDEAIEALEIARVAQEETLVAAVISDNADLLFDNQNASIMGNPDGAITLVEFLDYNCGFCKRAHADVIRLIAEQDDVRVVVKDFPVLGPGSLEAAQVAIAFRNIGGDMPAFIHAMMSEQNRPADAALARAVALGLGADEAALDLALDSPSVMEPIGEAYALAEELNIRGTPAFIVGEERLIGAVGFDRLAAAIQAERERL